MGIGCKFGQLFWSSFWVPQRSCRIFSRKSVLLCDSHKLWKGKAFEVMQPVPLFFLLLACICEMIKAGCSHVRIVFFLNAICAIPGWQGYKRCDSSISHFASVCWDFLTDCLEFPVVLPGDSQLKCKKKKKKHLRTWRSISGKCRRDFCDGLSAP